MEHSTPTAAEKTSDVLEVHGIPEGGRDVAERPQLSSAAGGDRKDVVDNIVINQKSVSSGRGISHGTGPTEVLPDSNSPSVSHGIVGDSFEHLARFRVSDTLVLVLQVGDITNWFIDGRTDAIVNAANSRMLGGAGVDGAIHKKAGIDLLRACKKVPQVRPGIRCPTGEARVTDGFNLPASKVVHTVGPIYFEESEPAPLLHNAYSNSLKAAMKHGIKYIAFPAISCGVYEYPPAEAAKVSLEAIKQFHGNIREVHFVLFHENMYGVWHQQALEDFTKLEDIPTKPSSTETNVQYLGQTIQFYKRCCCTIL